MLRLAESDVSSPLKQVLARRLRRLVERDPCGVESMEPPFISTIVSRRRETITEFATPATGLVVVIQGSKHVQWGMETRSYGAGDVFLLPAGSRIDVVNEPDEANGLYRALFLRFSRELVIEAARLWPEFVGFSGGDNVVTVGPELCAAILHAGEALAHASRRVIKHRLLEVVLILAEQGAMRLTPKYVDGSVADGIRLLVRHKLDCAWSGASIAASIGMSEATLRRRLREEGQSLRGLLVAERMRAAHVLLCDRDAQVAEAIAATGYTSRSHFARHFRLAFGISPATARINRKRGKPP